MVFFKNKKGNSIYTIAHPEQFLSEKSILRRVKQGIQIHERDLPVNTSYIDSVKYLGAETIRISKWFNAVLVKAEPLVLDKIKNLSFVSGIEEAFNNNATVLHNSSAKLSNTTVHEDPVQQQYSMVGIDKMHEEGLTGNGMTIAVFDGGFLGVDTIRAFSSLFINNKILFTHDFVTNKKEVYVGSSHGTQVFSLLAANSPHHNFLGGIPDADFLLYRTENVSIEEPLEEFNWLVAAESADSAGADIINSSIGYNTFDEVTFNHQWEDLNGKTTIISQAANIAASVGILVIASAGNEGNSAWKYVLAPADSDSVLTVGSADRHGNHVPTSSVGPTADGRIKPDVAACGQDVYLFESSGYFTTNTGTSFACPIITSLAAGIWQQYPNLTSQKLLEVIRASGSLYSNPNNLLGYGIPHFNSVKSLLPIVKSNKGRGHILMDDHKIIISDCCSNSYLEFFDVTGNRIKNEFLIKEETEFGLEIQIGKLPAGIYIIKKNDPSGFVYYKFFKE